LAAGFSILPCNSTDDQRSVIEIYPALMARAIIGKQSYKADDRRKQTGAMQCCRQVVMEHLRSPNFEATYGLSLDINIRLVEECNRDASGDTLDAVIATVQTAWAYRQPNYGIPHTCDRLEGWICGKL
ncbi:MAG: DUF429 domain-containing protein, partial [Pseudanabaena sp.]